MLTVHVRVTDEATGRPTPVRVRFAGPGGEYYPPLGRPAEFPVGRNEDVGGHVYLAGKRYAYIDGGCEVPLPAGVPLAVEISKGPGYLPIRETVTLGPGQLTLRFTIRQWPNPAWDDWKSADTRCHFLTPHSARLEAAAEGIDLVNLLAAAQDYPSPDGHMYRVVPNLTAFSGQGPALDGVYVNTFNGHPVLGRLGLLACHRPVYPLTFGTLDETDDWSLSDWCDQCHRKKGLVVWCDAYRPEAGLPGGEALVNAVLGKIDVIEVDALERTTSFLAIWYRLLNAGIRLPIVGGSGKGDNRTALGGMRTLTPRTPNGTYAEWVERVRTGQTVATSGPLLSLGVEGMSSTQPTRLTVEAAGIDPFERLEIVINGEVAAATQAESGEIHQAHLEVEQRLPAGGWVATRCWGTSRSSLYPHSPIFAHTSPLWVPAGEGSFPNQATARTGLIRELTAVREWAEQRGRFTNPRRKEALLSRCNEAIATLSGRA